MEYTLRTELTPSQRATPLQLTIDPGFVHHEKIETILGTPGMEIIDSAIAQLPEMPEGLKRARIDNIYTRVFVSWCGQVGIRTLQDTLAGKSGQMFCSTEKLRPFRDIYKAKRGVSVWESQETYGWTVEFHYSTDRVTSDTIRSRLSDGGIFSIIAEQRGYKDSTLIYEPIVIGSPWIERSEEAVDFDTDWFGQDFFENYVEDFDEFSLVRDIETPLDCEPMKEISEKAFKTAIASLLGDSIQKDWGGEQSDYYSAHMHLGGRRVKVAFLFKGPAKFSPMNLANLGKNNDQIVRLAHEPADVLVVQHCHDILSPVRETLRAFAVQPGRPRRFCLIDGRDSLRLLRAYDLYQSACELSKA